MSKPRHVVHLLYRFAAGGLENVLVQLINGLPKDEFRHTIIALTEADSQFAQRIQRDDVQIIALQKAPGQPFKLYPRMYRLLKSLKPDVMHTCNIAALEFMPVAAAAGVPLRIHAEHGWDVADPDGSNKRYQLLRKFYKHFVHDFIAVSEQLYRYLIDTIHLPAAKVHRVANGVDTDMFRPRQAKDALPSDFPFDPAIHYIVGSVGRLEPIKNQALLVDAFIAAARTVEGEQLRLVIIGAGPLKPMLLEKLAAAGLADCAWLPGARADIPQVMRVLSCFVLPSLAEGTSCTLQEAMATDCHIIATRVGGNPRLLEDGKLGQLVPSEDRNAMVSAILRCQAGGFKAASSPRLSVIARYSLGATLQQYKALFGRQ